MTDHIHHYVCDAPVAGWTVGTCKHCGEVKRHWDQVDGEKGSWRAGFGSRSAGALVGTNKKGRFA